MEGKECEEGERRRKDRRVEENLGRDWIAERTENLAEKGIVARVYPHHTCWPSSFPFQPTPLGIVSASLIAQKRRKEKKKRKKEEKRGGGGNELAESQKRTRTQEGKQGFERVLAKVYFFYGAIRCTRGLFALGDGK